MSMNIDWRENLNYRNSEADEMDTEGTDERGSKLPLHIHGLWITFSMNTCDLHL